MRSCQLSERIIVKTLQFNYLHMDSDYECKISDMRDSAEKIDALQAEVIAFSFFGFRTWIRYWILRRMHV